METSTYMDVDQDNASQSSEDVDQDNASQSSEDADQDIESQSSEDQNVFVQMSELPVILCKGILQRDDSFAVPFIQLDYVKQAKVGTKTVVSNYELKTTWSPKSKAKGAPPSSQKQGTIQHIALKTFLQEDIEVNTSVLVAHVHTNKENNAICTVERYAVESTGNLFLRTDQNKVKYFSLDVFKTNEIRGGEIPFTFDSLMKERAPTILTFLQNYEKNQNNIKKNQKNIKKIKRTIPRKNLIQKVQEAYEKGVWAFACTILQVTSGKLTSIVEVAELSMLIIQLGKLKLVSPLFSVKPVKKEEWKILNADESQKQRIKDKLEEQSFIFQGKNDSKIVNDFRDGFANDKFLATTIARVLGMFIHSDIENFVNNCKPHSIGKMRKFIPTRMNGIVNQIVQKLLQYLELSVNEIQVTNSGYTNTNSLKSSVICKLKNAVKMLEDNEFNVEKFLDARIKDSEKQLLVKWEGYDEEDATWETEESLQMDKQTFDDLVSQMNQEANNANQRGRNRNKRMK